MTLYHHLKEFCFRHFGLQFYFLNTPWGLQLEKDLKKLVPNWKP